MLSVTSKDYRPVRYYTNTHALVMLHVGISGAAALEHAIARRLQALQARGAGAGAGAGAAVDVACAAQERSFLAGVELLHTGSADGPSNKCEQSVYTLVQLFVPDAVGMCRSSLAVCPLARTVEALEGAGQVNGSTVISS
jgi:hypothetical protein